MPKPPIQNNSTGFDFPSVTKPMGYLHVDHRASPGLPDEVARRIGFDPSLTKEGKVFEADTLACAHCPSVFIKRPDRVRERGHCMRCNAYVCDACVIASKDPAYVHRTRQELIDLATSGQWTMTGSTSLPILTRKEKTDG